MKELNIQKLIINTFDFLILVLSTLVKLFGTIICGHAIAKDVTSVPFQFCSFYVICYRLTWFMFPYTILIISWLELWQIIQYRYFSSGSQELDESSCSIGGKKSLTEEEGVLTKRHNILKEREIIKIMKSYQLNQGHT